MNMEDLQQQAQEELIEQQAIQQAKLMQTQPKGMFAKMEQKIKIEEGEKKTAEVVKQIQSVKAPAPPVAKPLAVAAPIAAQPPLALV